MKLTLLFLAGLLFGAGLALSGMTNPAKVIGFLDITEEWDATLAFVMGGALLVFGGGMLLLRRLRSGKGCYGCDLPQCESEPVNRRLIFGAICFGVGWGLSGIFPGPALANLAAIRIEALVFVPAMAIGMALHRWLMPSRTAR